MADGVGNYGINMYGLVNQTSGADNTGYADGIIDFGDDSDLASKELGEAIEQGDQNALLQDLIVMGLRGADNAFAVEEFLGKATYGQAIDFLEKLDERDGDSEGSTLDATDGLETMTSGELTDIISGITGETEEADE